MSGRGSPPPATYTSGSQSVPLSSPPRRFRADAACGQLIDWADGSEAAEAAERLGADGGAALEGLRQLASEIDQRQCGVETQLEVAALLFASRIAGVQRIARGQVCSDAPQTLLYANR